MRNTKQKILIYHIINHSCDHLTAEQIYQEARISIPNISLGTVYRNLNNLVEEKKVRIIKMEDGTDRFDHMNDFHGHFICIKCNNIIDVQSEDRDFPENINGNQVMSY